MGYMTTLPGDPGVIRSYASNFSETSDALTNATTQLKELFSLHDGTISKAISKLSDVGGQVETFVTQANIRYSAAADALQEYAGQLESTQNRAKAAISDYEYAEAQLSAAHTAHDHAQHTASQTDPTDPNYVDNIRKVQQAQNHISQLQAMVAKAQGEWEAASRDKHTAAQQAAGKIRDGDELSQLNNNGLLDAIVSAWDGLMDWVSKNKDLVALMTAIASGIAKWAGYLSGIFALLALLPIPGVDALFLGLSLAAGIIAVVASLIAFVGTLLLAFVGAATVTDVIFAGLDVALSALYFIPGGAEAGAAAKTVVGSAVKTTTEKVVEEIVTQSAEGVVDTGVNVAHDASNEAETGQPTTVWDRLVNVGEGIELPFTPPNLQPESIGNIGEGLQSGDGIQVMSGMIGFDIDNSMVAGAGSDIAGDLITGWNDFTQGISVSLMEVNG
ncbi:MAG: putative T7SS-secreted protein [Pseudolysinimonas sp.]